MAKKVKNPAPVQTAPAAKINAFYDEAMGITLHQRFDTKLGLKPDWDLLENRNVAETVLTALTDTLGKPSDMNITINPNAYAGKLAKGPAAFFFMHTVVGGNLIVTDALGTDTRVPVHKGTLAIANGCVSFRFEPAEKTAYRGVAIMQGF